jgi:hypothetical protein
VVAREPLDRGDQRGANAATPLRRVQREDLAVIGGEHVGQHAGELRALFREQGRVVERALQPTQASHHVGVSVSQKLGDRRLVALGSRPHAHRDTQHALPG